MNAFALSSGTLVLVVGASGAGKDTLIEGARSRLADDGRYCFLRRSVTRPAGQWEDHASLTHTEFAATAQRGEFAFTWEAHGLQYGVPSASVELVRKGRVVVCNGSRGAIGTAMKTFDRLKLVLVTAPRELRLARLEARGREADTRERLDRLADEEFGQIADLVVVNDGLASEGTQKLLDFLHLVAKA